MGLGSELKGKFGFYRFGTNHTNVPASDIASVGYITFDGGGISDGVIVDGGNGFYSMSRVGKRAVIVVGRRMSLRGAD